jgi:hypothetical protein
MATLMYCRGYLAPKSRGDNDAQIAELNTAIGLLGAGTVRDHLSTIRSNLQSYWPTAMYAAAWAVPLPTPTVSAQIAEITASLALLPAGTPKAYLTDVRAQLQFEITQR